MVIYKKILLALFIALSSLSAIAQEKAVTTKDTKLNEVDAQGRKKGWWLNRVQERMGNPGYMEFGQYHKGQKTGLWHKMSEEGDLVAIENYRLGVYDGEVKYFNQGKLASIGHYRALNPDAVVDTIMVEDPVTGFQRLVPVRSDIGTVRHGMWYYYSDINGALSRIEEYQVDSLIYKRDFKPLTKADSIYYEKRAKRLPHARSSSSGNAVNGKHKSQDKLWGR